MLECSLKSFENTIELVPDNFNSNGLYLCSLKHTEKHLLRISLSFVKMKNTRPKLKILQFFSKTIAVYKLLL